MKLPREKWMPVKQVTTRSAIFAIQKPIAHLYTHGTAPPSLWWDPDALEPLSGENLAPLEKNQTYMTKTGTDIKMG